MDSGGAEPRNDRAVIMARGASSRMGTTKGLLRLSDSGPAFVRIIADLYLQAGIPVDVVTGHDTSEAYRRELPVSDELRVLPAGPGGDTALTLLIAWRSHLAGGIPCTHCWAHPVDLPLLGAATVSELQARSCQMPARVIRPRCEGVPGHPVILPGEVLAVLDRQDAAPVGPLRDFLVDAQGVGLWPGTVLVDVDDVGAVRDFDRPEDFKPGRSTARKNGAH